MTILGLGGAVSENSADNEAAEKLLHEALDAGIRYFIPKPYSAEAILHTLHEVLNGKN